MREKGKETGYLMKEKRKRWIYTGLALSLFTNVALLGGCGTKEAAESAVQAPAPDTDTVQEASTEASENYEDISQISQLITVGNLDIDIYQKDALLYFYHPDQEVSEQGADFAFSRNGSYGEQDIVTGYFNNTEEYTMIITSNEEQTSQIGIQKQGESAVSCLSDLMLGKGDVVKIEYNKEASRVYLNDSEISFEIVESTAIKKE